MNAVIGSATFVILWWLAFFAMLPMGAKSFHEAGEAPPPGSEHGAPKAHGLRRKAILASAIAAVLWLIVYWIVSVDFFQVRP